MDNNGWLMIIDSHLMLHDDSFTVAPMADDSCLVAWFRVNNAARFMAGFLDASSTVSGRLLMINNGLFVVKKNQTLIDE